MFQTEVDLKDITEAAQILANTIQSSTVLLVTVWAGVTVVNFIREILVARIKRK